MVKDFVVPKNRDFLMARVGDISQIAGIKRYEFIDGKAKGVEAVDIKTGSGFNFTVLPGRGMDIASASYQGVPVAYMSKTGITQAAYYNDESINWLRSFFAGLLTTCGLSNVGWPSEYNEPGVGVIKHGMHGRISNICADNVCVKEEWEGNELRMSVSGRMRESMLKCENLTLKREISAVLGGNALYITDLIENEGFAARPLMILYHINIGYPLLDQGSRLICNPQSTKSVDAQSADVVADFRDVHEPKHDIKENVYFHDLPCQKDGTTYVALINEKLEVGIYIKFNKSQLPEFTQWKHLGEGEYVMGLEPGNCIPVGLTAQEKSGQLQMLQPGEQKKVELEIGILTNNDEIEHFEEMMSELS